MSRRTTMRSSTLQLWIIIVFAMLMTAVLFFIGWYKGQSPGFWPSVAGIIFALWGAVSIMMRYIEDRKARENISSVQKSNNLDSDNLQTPSVPGWANEVTQKIQQFVSKNKGDA